jgi:hypothetical protein
MTQNDAFKLGTAHAWGRIPENPPIDKTLLGAYLRGYFDGENTRMAYDNSDY